MAGYTKLFSSILASTIWRAPNHTRLVWITMLAMSDKHGLIEASVPGLADFARVSVEDCRTALRELMAPDEDSRSKELNGRRIEEIDGGWRLVNHAKYRAKMGTEERREYLRLKQRESRAKKKASVDGQQPIDKSTLSTHAEADADADTDTDLKIKIKSVSSAPTNGAEPTEAMTVDLSPPASGVALVPHSLVVFPAIGTGPHVWGLTEPQAQDWVAAYPGLDVVAECRKAAAWVAADASRRKTARGMPRFLVGWLNRATDRPRQSLSSPARSKGERTLNAVQAALADTKVGLIDD